MPVTLQVRQVTSNNTDAHIFLSKFVRSTGTSPTRDESSDLISFSSPTSKNAPKEPHVKLKEYIEQINKWVSKHNYFLIELKLEFNMF